MKMRLLAVAVLLMGLGAPAGGQAKPKGNWDVAMQDSSWSQLLACDGRPRGMDPTWSSGAVWADTTSIRTRPSRILAFIWCQHTGGQSLDPVAPYMAWSDDDRLVGLPVDFGIAIAGNTASTANESRVRFRIIPPLSPDSNEYAVETVIEQPTSTGAWKTLAQHRIAATLRDSTFTLHSTFATRVKGATRFRTAPLDFARLDRGAVDTVRAHAAAKFLLATRARLGIPPAPASERILYAYSLSRDGPATLGFELLVDSINGFTTLIVPRVVFSGIRDAGEFYRHELVHAAVAAYGRPLPSGMHEALAFALGGTLHRTWPEFVCAERSMLLNREKVRELPLIFDKADSTVTGTIGQWELAMMINLLIAAKGDAPLRALIDGSHSFDSRAKSRASIAALMGITVPELMQQIRTEYSEEAIRARCRPEPVRRRQSLPGRTTR